VDASRTSGGSSICHPPALFSVIGPLINLFLGERLRKRVKVESGGSDERDLEKLTNYDLTKDRVPSELVGGHTVLDHKNWLLDRKASDL
jgi:hypothetical protein